MHVKVILGNQSNLNNKPDRIGRIDQIDRESVYRLLNLSLGGIKQYIVSCLVLD